MTFIAGDIETTGLTANDQVTVVGLANDDAYHIYYNAENGRVDEAEFEWESADRDIELHRARSEKRLLSKLDDAVRETQLHIEGNVLSGFNLDGFDIPMLRVRCAAYELDWAFNGVMCVDLQDSCRYHLQTTSMDVSGFNKKPLRQFGADLGANVNSDMYKDELVDAVNDYGWEASQVTEWAGAHGWEAPTDSYRTLDNIHELYTTIGIFDETPYDPLEGDSKQCVAAWTDGEIEDIIKHNLADLKMTLDVGRIAEEYLRDSELRVTAL